MSHILLRAFKRKTSWELSLEEFVKIELHVGGEPDLNLSVYEIEDEASCVVRTLVEHWVSIKHPEPAEPCRGFDASGGHDGQIESIPGDSCFRFTRECHREIAFMDAEELSKFASLILLEYHRRSRSASKGDFRAYIQNLLKLNDSEWVALLAMPEKAKWRKWVMRSCDQNVENAVLPPTES
jgi:hypothetical protein